MCKIYPSQHMYCVYIQSFLVFEGVVNSYRMHRSGTQMGLVWKITQIYIDLRYLWPWDITRDWFANTRASTLDLFTCTNMYPACLRCQHDTCTLKIKSRHDTNFTVTEGSGDCLYNNLRWQSWYDDNSPFSSVWSLNPLRNLAALLTAAQSSHRSLLRTEGW